jgi:hypothetical protein
MFIGNELRRGRFVSIHITWPLPGPPVGTDTTHVLTVWGDDGNHNDLTTNPGALKVTDSDRDIGGNVQTYHYDDYNDPAHQSEEGPGWYFNYTGPVHPYILHATTLFDPNTPHYCRGNVRVVGSYEITQTDVSNATGLHYDVGTDTTICRYYTTVDANAPEPNIVEHGGRPPRSLTVDWDLSTDPVEPGQTVLITTEFFLNVYNAIAYDNVQFTYDKAKDRPDLRNRNEEPGFFWSIDTPAPSDPNAHVPGLAGGFVVGAFELYDDPGGLNLVGRYRFEHEYSPGYDPEQHSFRLESRHDSTFYVGQLRFGHRWTFLDADALWALGPADWMPADPNIPALIALDPNTGYAVTMVWEGLLPYPPVLCSPPCRGDCNCDGLVNFADINSFVRAIIDGEYCDEIGWNADLNNNGQVGFEDINPFVALLTTGTLPILCP